MEPVFFDMSEQPDINVSLWGPGQSFYKTTAPVTRTTAAATPTTPPYSQCLDLENRMLDVSTMHAYVPPPCMHTTVIAGTDRRHSGQAAATPERPLPTVAHASAPKSRARAKNFVDPCDIAPLKKRRIQVELLAPGEREKVLHKREKNKLAAEKCRVKRREKVQKIRIEYDDLLEANEALEAELAKLNEEKEMIQNLLDNHHCLLKQTKA